MAARRSFTIAVTFKSRIAALIFQTEIEAGTALAASFENENASICEVLGARWRNNEPNLSICGQQASASGQSKELEARAGIEPACKDLQSSA